ncbi:MAG: hypothetical protein ACXV5I_07235 [Halobacteriota archaeon]
MWDTLRRRLMLLGVLLVAGALAGGAIAVLDMQKAIQGSNAEISVIKLPDSAQPATQRAEQQAKHSELLMSLISIASNNSTVQTITAGKNSTVVAIGVDKEHPQNPNDVATALLAIRALGTGVGGLSQNPNDVGTAVLFIKVDSTFYAITEDVLHNQVTAIEERVCYGAQC